MALIALAVQLVLSFGHVHADKAALFAPAVAAISVPQLASGGNAPPDPDRRPGANDFCAICAAISMASSLVLPEPTRLTPPVAHAHAWSRKFEAALATSAPHLLFQARAPPRASLLG